MLPDSSYQAPAEHRLLSRSACSFETPWALSQAKQDRAAPHRCKTRHGSSVTFSGQVSKMDSSSTGWHSIQPRSSSSASEAADNHPLPDLPPRMFFDPNNLQDFCCPRAITNSADMRSYPPLAAKKSHSQLSSGSCSIRNTYNWEASSAAAGNNIGQVAPPQTRPNVTLMTGAGYQEAQQKFPPSNMQWGIPGASQAHPPTDPSSFGRPEQQCTNAQCQTVDNDMLDSSAGIEGIKYSHLADFSFTALDAALPFQPQLPHGYDESYLYPLSPPINNNDHLWQSTPRTGAATSDLKRKRQHPEQSPSMLTPAPSQHDGSPMAGSLLPSLTRRQDHDGQPITQNALARVANIDQMLPTAGLEFDDEFSAPFDLSGFLDQHYEPLKDTSQLVSTDHGLSNGVAIKADTAAQDGADWFWSSPDNLRAVASNRSNPQRDLDPSLLDAEGTSLRDFVVQSRNNGVPYRRITADLLVKYQIDIAESTVRGKHRTWTIPKEQRARKPEWPDQAVSAPLLGNVDFHADFSEDSMLVRSCWSLSPRKGRLPSFIWPCSELRSRTEEDAPAVAKDCGADTQQWLPKVWQCNCQEEVHQRPWWTRRWDWSHRSRAELDARLGMVLGQVLLIARDLYSWGGGALDAQNMVNV